MTTETGHTIAIRAMEVIGTDVYDASGEKIGKVEDVMLDKMTSRIMFAVVSVGGAVTTSNNFFPMPWSVLDYQEQKAGYVVAQSRDHNSKGPSDTISALTKNDGAGPRKAAYDHYQVAKDW